MKYLILCIYCIILCAGCTTTSRHKEKSSDSKEERNNDLNFRTHFTMNEIIVLESRSNSCVLNNLLLLLENEKALAVHNVDIKTLNDLNMKYASLIRRKVIILQDENSFLSELCDVFQLNFNSIKNGCGIDPNHLIRRIYIHEENDLE